MSGHSKWATIKRQKGASDIKRGAVFTKLSNAITVAVRQGGGTSDPNQNFKLRLAVDAARTANMPKENIERAIVRAAGKQGEMVEEFVYEGFSPGGISIIVEATTDNKNRTTGEVKNVFDKNGGTMGIPGSVAYQFKQRGRIIIKKEKAIDDIFMEAADSGAEDIEEVGDEVFIYTNPSDLGKVRDGLLAKSYTLEESAIIWQPLTMIEMEEGEKAEKVMLFLEKLEALDDVQKVYSNFELQ